MTKLPRYTAPVTVQGRVYTPEELAARDRAAYRAADLHQSGYMPKESDLAGAPHIDDWAAQVYVGEDGKPFVCLDGLVTGHPNNRMPTPMRTSLIIAIDEKAGWARTYGRYYRLGTRRALIPVRELSEPAEGYDPADHGGETHPCDIVRPEDDLSGDDDDQTNACKP